MDGWTGSIHSQLSNNSWKWPCTPCYQDREKTTNSKYICTLVLHAIMTERKLQTVSTHVPFILHAIRTERKLQTVSTHVPLYSRLLGQRENYKQ